VSALLTPAEAARDLKISVRTLRGHVDDGAIRYIIVGRGKKRPRIAFAPADIEEFERQRRRRKAKIETKPCRSIGRKARHTGITTSGSNVVAFSALRANAPSPTRAK
jgi:excisionase family DNA binding protein